jgi:hypothetical protein
MPHAEMLSGSIDHVEGATWRVVGASAAGSWHSSNNAPCQDAFSIRVTNDDWLVAVLADGAGSAVHGGIGARAVVEGIVGHLSKILHQSVHLPSDQSFWRHEIETAIGVVRASLQAEPSEPDSRSDGLPIDPPILSKEFPIDPKAPSVVRSMLHDFHATVVGAIVGPDSGLFVHIGDGVAVACSATDLRSFTVSAPANGETIEETYFFTDQDWRKHLRLTDFGHEHDLIVLLSDGAMSFAMAPQLEGLSPNFINPVTAYLSQSPNQRGALALQRLLDCQAARDISADDKTMIWARRRGDLSR